DQPSPEFVQGLRVLRYPVLRAKQQLEKAPPRGEAAPRHAEKPAVQEVPELLQGPQGRRAGRRELRRGRPGARRKIAFEMRQEGDAPLDLLQRRDHPLARDEGWIGEIPL